MHIQIHTSIFNICKAYYANAPAFNYPLSATPYCFPAFLGIVFARGLVAVSVPLQPSLKSTLFTTESCPPNSIKAERSSWFVKTSSMLTLSKNEN